MDVQVVDDSELKQEVKEDTDVAISFPTDIALYCDPCRADGEEIPADGYCKDCREYLCAGCFKVHRRPTVTRHHILLDKEYMPRDVTSVNAAKDVCTEQCIKHEHKIVEYYCRTHEELGCSVCMTTRHRTCLNVDYVPDIVDDVIFENEVIALENGISELKDFIKVGHSRLTSLDRAIDINEKMALGRVRDLRVKLDTYFDKLEKVVTKDITELKEDDRKNVSSVKEKLSKTSAIVDTYGTEISEKRTGKQYCKLFLLLKRNQTDVKYLKEETERMLEKNIIRRYEFLPEQRIKDIKDYIKEFGELVIKESSVKVAATAESLNVKTDVDQVTSNISGLELLCTDRLLAVDSMNKAVKLINIPENKIEGQYNCPSEPWDVAKIDGLKVAVTLPNMTSIEVLNVQENGIIIRNTLLEVNRNCYGISYADEKLYVTYNNPGCVYVLNLRGETIHSFTQSFGVPWYISLSPDSRCIYVADTGQNSVTLMDVNGKIKAVFKDECLLGLRGLTTDKAGSVYACGWGSNNVVQMTSYCTKEQTLQDGKLRLARPYSAAYCDVSERLFVGMSNDQIRVIQFH
ncbi:uncharacterized protein LOC128203324 [Mya arenaria]|uniref:uncharacterized protein LOC128203324 n=1 Tax=Mya arenaria TaxID=6604 RepID=UPI0022E71F85|nr:uncharacterized protein LOC128203324 [Mya arenaria]